MTVDLSPTAVTDGFLFPECPRWHDGRLFFSDVHGHRVVSMDPDGTVATEATFDDDRPSGLGFDLDGALLVASHFHKHVFRFSGGQRTTMADFSGLPGEYLNDMVVDRHGRAYVGARVLTRYGGPAGATTAPGQGREHLLLAEPDGRVRVVAEGIVAPNGMVISEDGRRLIVAETHAHRLSEFDIEEDGTLANQRVFAQMGDEVWPDGIALDADDGVWIGSPQLGRFLRIERGGAVSHQVPIDGRWAVACALGGPGRSTLYMLTTVTTLDNLNRLSHDLSLDPTSESEGRIETTGAPFPGAGIP
jgi:sugar lactone lactonase YvrE